MAQSQEIHAVDAFEPETRGTMDSEKHNTVRPKRKELEKHIYVHLSEDQSDPELIAPTYHQVSRSPSTVDHIDKVTFLLFLKCKVINPVFLFFCYRGLFSFTILL